MKLCADLERLREHLRERALKESLGISSIISDGYERVVALAERHPRLTIYPVSMFLFTAGIMASAWAQATPPTTTVTVDTSAVDEAICWIMWFQHGSFGALLMTVCAVGGIVTAATGHYRKAVDCLVVGLGTILIKPLALLYFEYFPTEATCQTLTKYKQFKLPMG